MFTLDGIRKFHAWTHASLDVLFDHLAELPASDFMRELPGFGYASIHAQVIHLLACEARWVRRLQGQPTGDWNPAQWPSLVDARKLQREIAAQTLAYLAALTDQLLNTGTTLHFPDGDTAVRTPALVLHHVFTHAFHHKGQVVAMCRILGHPAPDTDLNQFE
ncbi:MAG: DinB family protein [Acidobacteriaceae bacterium]